MEAFSLIGGEKVKLFSITDIGRRREINEDYLFTSDKPVGNLPNLFIVADGMGGHNAGDYASKHAVEKAVSAIEQYTDEYDAENILQKQLMMPTRTSIRSPDTAASIKEWGRLLSQSRLTAVM